MRLVLLALLGLVALGTFAPTSVAAPKPRSVKVDGSVKSLAVSPDGNWVAVGARKKAPVLFFVGEPPKAPTSDDATSDKSGDGTKPDDKGSSDPPAAATPAPPARRELKCPPCKYRSLTFTSDSKYLVAIPDLEDEERHVLVFDVATADVALKIDCGKNGISNVRPVPEPGRFLALSLGGAELWDATTGKQVWKREKASVQQVFASQDGSVLVGDRFGKIVVLDPTTYEVDNALADVKFKGAQRKPKSSNKILTPPSLDLCGLSLDGKIAVAHLNQQLYDDIRKLSNTNVDPKKRLKTVKKFRWIEAVDVETGKSRWSKKVKDTFSWEVSCIGDRVAFVDGKKVKLFEVTSGTSKGTLTSSAAVTAFASSDGRTWWFGDEKGKVSSKRMR